MSTDTRFEWRIRILLFVLALTTFAYFSHAGQDNENAHLDQTRSIVERGSVNITGLAWNSADVVKYGENYYPNKAPGISFAAIPSWIVFSKIVPLFPGSKETHDHILVYLVNLFSVGIFSALLCVMMWEVLRYLTKSDRGALLLTLGYTFGTIAFPFSTIFFSHQFSASILFLSFGILLLRSHTMNDQKRFASGWWVGAAGFLCGFAAVTEYPTALAIMPISLYALWTLKTNRERAFFIIGAGSAGSLLIMYNLLAFGKVYFIPYAVYTQEGQAAFPEHKRGYMGVSIPDFQVLLDILIRPQRGLFFCNPWLVFFIPGLVRGFFKKAWRAEWIVCAFIVLAFLTFNAGFAPGIVYAGGGASVGPRHSIPMLPFAVVLISFLIEWTWIRALCLALIIPSVAVMLMAAAVEPRVPYEYTNPVKQLFISNFLDGRFALARHGVFSSQFMTENSVAFNLGKLAHLLGALQLAPLLLLWWFLSVRLFREMNRGGEQAVSGTVSTVVSILIFALLIIPPCYGFVRKVREDGMGGLRGTYFSSLLWKGCEPAFIPANANTDKFIKTQVDPAVDFLWQGGPPIEGQFSIEWRGLIDIKEGGRYRFATRSDDGSCLYIDGKLLIDNWGVHGPLLKDGYVELSRGEHAIDLQYVNDQFGASIELLWMPPERQFDIIPSTVLKRRGEKEKE